MSPIMAGITQIAVLMHWLVDLCKVISVLAIKPEPMGA